MSFFAFIFSFFIGDANVNGYPFSLLLFVFALLTIKTIHLEKRDLINFGLLFTFLILNMYKGFDLRYVTWPVNAFLLSIIIRAIDIKAFSLTIVFYFVIVWFLLNFINSDFGANRFDFVFGPNVQYRIFTVLFILFIINRSFELNLKTTGALFVSVLGGVLTGSRGFIPLLMISNIKLIKDNSAFRKVVTVISFFSVVLAFVYLDEIISSVMNSRLFYFSLENSSLAIRVDLLVKFFTDPLSLISPLGISEVERMSIFIEGFPYPHNFILEIFIYYGFYGAFIFIIFLLNNLPKWDSEYTPFLIAACTWSLFSGDFGDNYVIFSLLVAARTSRGS